MKLHTLLIIGFALCVAGCQNKEQVAEPVATEDPVATEEPVAKEESYSFDGIVKHMHGHADQLDLINVALADGDLETAKLPARWLWRHNTMEGVPDDWHSYLSGMREAARAVETATDLETARAASNRINEQCQACHTAAGVYSTDKEPEGT